MKMQWKLIENYPEYEVSDTGLVRRATNGRHIKAGEFVSQVNVLGYPAVCLFQKSKPRMERVHRLVAMAFLPPAKEGETMVAHNDGSRANNNAANLRWATCLSNLSDRAAHGTELRGSRNGRAKLNLEAVEFIRANYKPRHPEYGAAILAAKFGVTDVAVIKAYRGENWSHVI